MITRSQDNYTPSRLVQHAGVMASGRKRSGRRASGERIYLSEKRSHWQPKQYRFKPSNHTIATHANELACRRTARRSLTLGERPVSGPQAVDRANSLTKVVAALMISRDRRPFQISRQRARDALPTPRAINEIPRRISVNNRCLVRTIPANHPSPAPTAATAKAE